MISAEGSNPSATAPLLELRNVSRSFKIRQGLMGKIQQLWAVADLSIKLLPGETLGLVGESGCGKSTLARMAVGLLPTSSGEVLLNGQPLAKALTEARHPVQMIFQDPFSSLNPRLTIGRCIREPLDVQGKLPLNERKNNVAEMLQLVGLLPEHANRYPHEFSGGQRQRAVVARALISRPSLVVCDEPVSSLDASVQAQVLNLLKNLQDRFSPSYLFISHDLSVVGHMSDSIAVMYLGRIVELAANDELFNQPLHPYTQALLAAIPDAGSHAQCVLKGDPPSPLQPPAGCAFHPRCPKAMPICVKQKPELITLNRRSVACWLYETNICGA